MADERSLSRRMMNKFKLSSDNNNKNVIAYENLLDRVKLKHIRIKSESNKINIKKEKLPEHEVISDFIEDIEEDSEVAK